MYLPNQKVTGFHGTYPENIEGILTDNFRESHHHNIWIGDGVYFFVNGIGVSPPSEYAKQFAIDNCYDKRLGNYTKTEICVLEAIIKVNPDRYLDLTTTDGAQLFNDFRIRTIKKIENSGKRPVNGEYNDSDVFKIMREELGIEFVRTNVYIRFAIQRIRRIESRIPNVTILVVNNPKRNIQKTSLRVIYKGVI